MSGSIANDNDGELPPSPCVGLCRMDAATALCQGCLRTIDEIVAWGQADDAYKRTVWLAIAQRQAIWVDNKAGK